MGWWRRALIRYLMSNFLQCSVILCLYDQTMPLTVCNFHENRYSWIGISRKRRNSNKRILCMNRNWIKNKLINPFLSCPGLLISYEYHQFMASFDKVDWTYYTISAKIHSWFKEDLLRSYFACELPHWESSETHSKNFKETRPLKQIVWSSLLANICNWSHHN